ncbi:patatin-like phospholipase family protein [Wenzhouxiangella limi]|uniref:PNPLA domain-containing protein n=1 Tax=Wenzhouxiangella limi TaxID=2707351 RepID=A0A845UVE7_9GAMM|nr:patatin-like phospholipase family protein [Wenzhouxiangella limi]NDY94514.1 hypothetical protein [Wenzhouxiangella limi]
MLKLTPASQDRQLTRPPTIGLAIAGGGPLGAIYELGALQALEEAIDGVRMHDLDVYVGVSSGSFLTASLANRITTSQMSRIFMSSPEAEFRFQPELFLRPAVREYFDRAMSVPGVVLDILVEAMRHPERIAHLESIESLSRLIPTGIFDNHSIDDFVAGILARPGRSNDFRNLSARLRIVAVDLETGQAVRFGESGRDHVPISTAVQASAALPGLYPPVEIDGHYFVDGALRRTLHASVALKEGADLLIGINPLVPYDAELDPQVPPDGRSSSRMIKGGLPVVLSQTFRSLIQSRMQVGMAKYQTEFPGSSILLVEPNRNDERMFFTNVFSYSSRNELVDHAYRTTRAELLARADAMESFLEPYELGLNRQILRKERSFTEAMAAEKRYLAPMGNSLARSLDQLDRLLRG